MNGPGAATRAAAADDGAGRRRHRPDGSAFAGPLLIVVAVVVVLSRVVFLGIIPTGDVPTFFLPNYCFLGRSLAAGHIPGWNPYAMGGVPFAADPQSGWMYALPMLLFTALPCAVAIRVMLVTLPVLAGLGLYAFLRIEGVPRPVSTMGGLVLALGVSGAALVSSLPFSGTLAWTAVMLAAAARYVRAGPVARRVGWGAVVAIVWGQLAAAHFSVGLGMGTAILLAYLCATGFVNLRARTWTLRTVAALLGLLVVALPLVNLAFILPRLQYLKETSIGLGYTRLQELSVRLTGQPALRVDRFAAGTRWPLKFATWPGTHIGAIPLALMFAGWWSRRRRPLVAALSLYGVVSYLATLKAVASRVPASIRSLKVLDFYVHSPPWLGYGMLVALAALAAFGMETWLGETSTRRRLAMVAPGVLVWWVLPGLFGATLAQLSFLLAGAAMGVVLAVVAMRGAWAPNRVAVGVVVVLAGALVASGLVSYRPGPFEPIPGLFEGLPASNLHAASFLRPGAIEAALAARPDGRTLTFAVPGWARYQADPRSPVFRVQEVQGYNPVQLLRYWSFVRTTNPQPLGYNLSIWTSLPPPVAQDLLHVRTVISARRAFGDRSSPAELREDGIRLYDLRGASALVTVADRWTVTAGPESALAVVTAPGFDPEAEVVLERPPTFSGTPPGQGAPVSVPSATARFLGEQALRAEVAAARPSILLVRIPFAANWHATVDGSPVPILPADALVQGVLVGPGRHVVVLSYGDPWIGRGLVGSAAALALLAVVAVAARRRERRVSPRVHPQRAVESAEPTAGAGEPKPSTRPAR